MHTVERASWRVQEGDAEWGFVEARRKELVEAFGQWHWTYWESVFVFDRVDEEGAPRLHWNHCFIATDTQPNPTQSILVRQTATCAASDGFKPNLTERNPYA